MSVHCLRLTMRAKPESRGFIIVQMLVVSSPSLVWQSQITKWWPRITDRPLVGQIYAKATRCHVREGQFRYDTNRETVYCRSLYRCEYDDSTISFLYPTRQESRSLPDPIAYNITHDNNLVAMAFAPGVHDPPAYSLGIDVMKIKIPGRETLSSFINVVGDQVCTRCSCRM